MSTIRGEVINAVLRRACTLVNYSFYDDIYKIHELKKQIVLDDKSLTKDEKIVAIRKLDISYDRDKITMNQGTKRVCENCNRECLATLYCEYCVRNHLEENFSNWTSGNDDVDKLIQECQRNTLMPSMIVEWIPYNNLQDIKYLTKGGCSEIYTASWIDGHYVEWDPKERQLKRLGRQTVILKRLEIVENASQNWFKEAKSHLTIGSKWGEIIPCYGLTRDPSNGSYMLVMLEMDVNLRGYLQKNHNQLTWNERVQIAVFVIHGIYKIHYEKAVHRDLHSGNVLYSEYNHRFGVSDLGFCGPVDSLSKNIYGNLPYIAPEVIAGKGYTFKSDIYSIGILMWEISSGKPPFIGHDYDDKLARYIVNGIRPKIIPGTPLEYKSLMELCWDADPLKRPNINTLLIKMDEINLHQNISSDESIQSEAVNDFEINSAIRIESSRLFKSKIYQFENFPEPRNATKEEQEAFHSKLPDDNANQNNDKSSSIIRVSGKRLQIN